MKDNIWRRYIVPKLKEIGLEWNDLHILWRTHAPLMREFEADPKMVAHQRAQARRQSEHVYPGIARAGKQAVDALKKALLAK